MFSGRSILILVSGVGRASWFLAPWGRRYKRKIRGADNCLIAKQIDGDHVSSQGKQALELSRILGWCDLYFSRVAWR
jgi:hypothetical protein